MTTELRATISLFEKIQAAARECCPAYRQQIADAIAATKQILIDAGDNDNEDN